MTVALLGKTVKDNRLALVGRAVIFFCYKKQTVWQKQAMRSVKDHATLSNPRYHLPRYEEGKKIRSLGIEESDRHRNGVPKGFRRYHYSIEVFNCQ